MRRATPATTRNNKNNIFLSTLSLRRATDVSGVQGYRTLISIHALLAESDHYDNYNLHCVEISIHALLAESDQVKQTCRAKISISIHALLAESDSSMDDLEPSKTHFYPRSPCGERQQAQRLKITAHRISIHALLAESDYPKGYRWQNQRQFLSTLSLRRATQSRH